MPSMALECMSIINAGVISAAQRGMPNAGNIKRLTELNSREPPFLDFTV